jgi:polyferredoxin
MMDATSQPRGLIRYASERMIAESLNLKFNARTIAYSAVLMILLGVFTYSITSRKQIEATILRAPGMLYQEPEPGKISNLYNIKLVNKTGKDLPVDIRLLSHEGEIKIIGNPITVKSQDIGESVFFLLLDKKDVTSDKIPVRFGIFSEENLIEEITSTFVGPNAP